MLDLDNDLDLQCELELFCGEPPAVHSITAGDADLRQVLCFGATEAFSGLRFLPGASVCIETARGRLHAFQWEGQAGELPHGAFPALAAIADAASPAQGPGCTLLQFEYRRNGWRVLEVEDELAELFTDGPPQGGEPQAARLTGHDAGLLAAEPREPADALWSALGARFPELDRPELRERAWKRLYACAAPLVEAFLARLQPLAVDACRALSRPGIGAYNAIAHPVPRIALYRAQALRAVPAVGVILIDKQDNWLLPLRLAIDSRASLAAAAARALKVRKEAIRFLAGKELQALGLDDPEASELWLGAPHYVMACIAAVDPAHRPATGREWAAFHALIRPLRQWQEYLPGLIAPFLRRAGKRGYADTLASVERKLRHATHLADFGSYLHSLWRAARGRRRNADPEAEAEFRRTYSSTRGLPRLAMEAERWRKAVLRETTRLMAELEKETGAGPIELPFTPPETIEGHRIVFLDSGAEMVAESLRMSHCVETLYPATVRGERLAFSIRDESGRAIATFDVSLRPAKGRCVVKLNELNGPGNEPACPAACGIVLKFQIQVAALLEGREAAVAAWLEDRKRRLVGALERQRQRLAKDAELAATRPFLARSGLVDE